MNARRLRRLSLLAMFALVAACSTSKPGPAQRPEPAAPAGGPTEREEPYAEVPAPALPDTASDVEAVAPEPRLPMPNALSEGPGDSPRAAGPASKASAAERADDGARALGSAGGASGLALAPQAPRERPGLATTWGENLYAPVQGASFQRRSSAPLGVLRALYNDRTGSRYSEDTLVHPAPQAGLGPVSLSLEDEHGRAFSQYEAGGYARFVGERDARYVIVLRNHSAARLEAVVSVDGLDVIRGKPASTLGRGYILAPYGDLRVEGFRRSDSQVAAFRFGGVAESYAARTGHARDVGVIGVALFEEQVPPSVVQARPPYVRPWPYARTEEQRLRESANPFPDDPRYAHPPR